MCTASVCLSACFAAAILISAMAGEFQFETAPFRRDMSCRVCYEAVCWPIDFTQCYYYIRADAAMGDSEEPGATGVLDLMIYDLVEAAPLTSDQDCLPYVSQYSNCHKENICLGCTVCYCDGQGRWSCSEVQRCRHEEDLVVDSKILNTVIHNLVNDERDREKRSLLHKEVCRKIKYSELVEWMYGVPATNAEQFELEANTDNLEAIENITALTMAKLKEFNNHAKSPNSIELDNNNPYKANHKYSKEAVAIRNFDKAASNRDIGPYDYDYTELEIFNENPKDADVREIMLINPLNIKKRDIFAADNTTVAPDPTTIPQTELSPNLNITNLQTNVLLPLTNIISDKEKELIDLMKIKEHLTDFIQTWNFTQTNITAANIINEANQIYSIYKIDVNPEEKFSLRKINPDNFNKMLYKVRMDLQEVIKDFRNIQRTFKDKQLPNDLTRLIKAMSYYIKNKSSDNLKDKPLEDTVRVHKRNNNATVKTELIKILRFLSVNMSSNDILTPLARPVRQVLKRVVMNNFVDEFSGIEVDEPEYNLTNILRNIGKDWDSVINQFEQCQATDGLYCLKLLHIVLSNDIAVLTNTLSLINYAQNRRMMPIEGVTGVKLAENISLALTGINEKIQKIINYKNDFAIKTTTIRPTAIGSKRSLFRKLKNLLRQSKKEIKKLVDQGVSKDEIVKKIARKKLSLKKNRLDDFEQTMRKWQKSMNVENRRYKRALGNRFRYRMKNIIPNYLRGKLEITNNTKANQVDGKEQKTYQIKSIRVYNNFN